MGSTKKPAKKYRPKLKANPLQVVSNNLSPLTADEKTTILVVVHNALNNLVRGEGTKYFWEVVTGALNTALVLDEQVFMKAHSGVFDEAMQAHQECGKRFKKTGNFGYSGKELQAVNYAVTVHEAQLDCLTFKELQNALAEVKVRLQNHRVKYSVFTKEERV